MFEMNNLLYVYVVIVLLANVECRRAGGRKPGLCYFGICR